MGHAMGLLADRHAFWAVFSFAGFVGAFDLAVGLLAFHVTDSVSRLLAGSVASRGLAYRIANGWAFRIVAFPSTLGMAFWLLDLDVCG